MQPTTVDNFISVYATLYAAMHIKDYYWHKPISNKKEFKHHEPKKIIMPIDSRMVITSYDGLVKLVWFSLLLVGLYTPLSTICWYLLGIWIGWICLKMAWSLL